MRKITLAILLALACLIPAVSLSQDKPSSDCPPLLTFADLQKNDSSEEQFRIVGYVVDVYKCHRCPAGAMCKPCIGDHIVATDNLDEKDPALIKHLRIFNDKPEQFELKKKYLFTVKVKGKMVKEQPIPDVVLVSFTAMPD